MGDAAGPILGIDFGTTNTVIAIHDGDGPARVVRFPTPGRGATSAFRSVLSFRERAAGEATGAVEAGPWAIAAFLDDPLDTRLIQSFKSFAASAAFAGTAIFGKRFQFEDLLFAFLRRVLAHGGEALARRPSRTVVGRPVVFSGAHPDEALALGRYGAAFGRLELPDAAFAYEPVGAAVFFAERIQSAAVVLVADFGGGTSDFSVMRFRRRDGRLMAEPLSRAGVGVAGDAFDYQIIDHAISPHLGKGTSYRSGDKLLPIPARYYAAFARWNQLALLKWTRDMREIREVARTAVDRDGIGRFIELLDDDHGYRLYQAVSAAKEALSSEGATVLRFKAGGIDIEQPITRSDFDRWIGRELAAIETALDQALADAGLEARQIDKVFLTGGSSFVPAVREIFRRRFAADAIETGGEFESIASGLAMIDGHSDLAGAAAP